MLRIMLDAGHSGKVFQEEHGNGSSMDKNDILKTTLAVGEILAEHGVDVFYTRTDNRKMSWIERAEIAEEIKPNIIISIQRYAGHDNCTYEGMGSLIYDYSSLARRIAENINRYLTMYHFITHGIIEVQSESAVFTRFKIPVLMQMVGLINTEAGDEEFETRFQELVWAISAGILETFQPQLNGNYNDDAATYYRGDAEGMEDLYKPGYRYRIQVGLFRSNENALQYQKQLHYNGFDSDLARQGEFYAVHVGRFDDLDEAAIWEKVLRRMGYHTLLISV